MSRLVRLAMLTSCLLVLGAESKAFAWTNAQVGSARGTVRVDPDGRLGVSLQLDVRVMGGWLGELEIAGLDRPLAIDESVPPTFTRADGTAVPFRFVSDAGGRVVFQFESGRGPRVGDYVASFAYTSALDAAAVSALDAERVRYTWTFPAWAAGLDAVDLVLEVPAGASPVDVAEDGFEESARVESVADRTRLTFHRTYLPRGVEWPLGFSLPREAVPAAMRPPAPAAPRVATAATSRDGRPQPLIPIVAGLLTVVAIAKRFAFARAARQAGCLERPLVPLRPLVAVLLMIALGSLAAWAWRRWSEVALAALVAVVALATQRLAKRTATPRLGGFRPATRADATRARWGRFVESVSPLAWLDASRLVGLLTYVGVVAIVVRFHLREPADSVDAVFSIPHALFLLFLLFLVGGCARIPSGVDARLGLLEGVARSMVIPPELGTSFALSLALHRDTHDVPQDARLRFVTESRAPGLVRLDVAVIERPTLGGYVAAPAVLVVVRQGSEAERILVRASGASSIRTAPGGRRARILPLSRSTFALLARLTEPVGVAPPRRVASTPVAAESLELHA